MNLFALIAIVAIAILVLNNIRKRDPEAEACAQAILSRLKQKKSTSAAEFAEILKQHGRNAEDAGKVLKLIRPRLVQAGIRKDERNDVMYELGKAKLYLSKA